MPFTVGFHLGQRSESDQQETTDTRGRHMKNVINEEEDPLLPDTNSTNNTLIAQLKRRVQQKFPCLFLTTSKPKPNTNTVLIQDGFISSLAVFLMWTAGGVSLALARQISQSQSFPVREYAVECSQLVNMFISSVIMWLFSGYKTNTFSFMREYIVEGAKCEPPQSTPPSLSSARDVNSSSSGDAAKSQQTEALATEFVHRMRGILQSAIPLIGILLFYIAGMIMDVLRIIAHIECMSVYSAHHCSNAIRKYIISILCNGWRIVYKGSLIVFIFKFHGKSFKQCSVVRYLLLFILSSVTINWFASLLFTLKDLFVEPARALECNSPNNTDAEWELGLSGVNLTTCLKEETDLYGDANLIAPYIYPLHIEFALMVGEILFHLYFSVKTETPQSINKEGTPTKSSQLTGELPISPDSCNTVHETTNVDDQNHMHSQDQSPLLTSHTNHTLVTQAVVNQTGPHQAAVLTRGTLEESTCMSLPCLDGLQNGEIHNKAQRRRPNSDHLRAEDSTAITTVPCETSDYSGESLRHRRIGQTSTPQEHSGRHGLNPDMALTRVGQLNTDKLHNRDSALANKKTPIHRARGLPILFAPIVVLSIMLFTLGMLTQLDNPEDQYEHHGLSNNNCNDTTIVWRKKYEYYKMFYHITLTVAAIVGFIACRECVSNFHPYNPLELLVLFVSFGTKLHIFLFIIAASNIVAYEGDEPCLPHVLMPFIPTTIITKIISLAQVYTQTTFFLHAGRIKLPKVNHMACVVFKNCLVVLAVGNLTWWVTDTFAEVTNHKLTPVQTYYYDKGQWDVISHILYPFSLFYRFNSFLLILGVYLEH